VLSRPVRRWEFIVGKFLDWQARCGDTFFMALGFFAALFYVVHRFAAADVSLLVALYFIVLQFFIITSLALLFSSFSSPILSAVLTFAFFVIGAFAEELRTIAGLVQGFARWPASDSPTWCRISRRST